MSTTSNATLAHAIVCTLEGNVSKLSPHHFNIATKIAELALLAYENQTCFSKVLACIDITDAFRKQLAQATASLVSQNKLSLTALNEYLHRISTHQTSMRKVEVCGILTYYQDCLAYQKLSMRDKKIGHHLLTLSPDTLVRGFTPNSQATISDLKNTEQQIFLNLRSLSLPNLESEAKKYTRYVQLLKTTFPHQDYYLVPQRILAEIAELLQDFKLLTSQPTRSSPKRFV